MCKRITSILFAVFFLFSSTVAHADIISSDQEKEEIVNSGDMTIILIAGLVVALVAGTGILLKIFWKQNKINEGGQNHV